MNKMTQENGSFFRCDDGIVKYKSENNNKSNNCRNKNEQNKKPIML